MAESLSVLNQKLLFEWKVKNIFLCTFVESQVLHIGGTQWKLFLKMFGDSYSNFYISFEKVKEEAEKVSDRIFTETYIKDCDGRHAFTRKEDIKVQYCSQKTIWWASFDHLHSERSRLLTDGILTFILNLEWRSSHYDNEIHTTGKLIQTSHPVDPVPSMESLSFDLRRLLDDRTHSDVTLKCEDHTIAAHRAILSARSEVFSAMLRSDMSESRDGVITVIDIEAPILEQLVQYIYSGSIPELSANTAQRLYEAADKYAIESLKTQCSDFMKENLTKENAWNVLVLADAHFDEDLKEQAISFIVRTHLLMDDTWAEFRVDYPLLAKEVDSLADPVICSSRQSGRYQHSN